MSASNQISGRSLQGLAMDLRLQR